MASKICYYLAIAAVVLSNSVYGQEKSSLTFVIDDTGSMGDDIAAVKNTVNAIFDTVMNSNSSQIEDFVLVTFNDPDSVHRVTTRDRGLFKRALSNIDVDGGGDCPEMAMHGTELALKQSRQGSLVYVFTDASAKDPGIYENVKRLAQKKQCQVVFGLTGVCSWEGNGEVYDNLASATYGQVFHLDRSRGEVEKILKYVQTQINNRKTVIANPTFPPGTHKFDYTVDSKMKELIISVSGLHPSVSVTDPDGGKVSTEEVVKTPRVAIVKVTEVKPGTYTAEVSSSSRTSVVVTAATTVHFQHGFSVSKPTSIGETATRPIPGEPSHLSVKLTTESDSDLRLETVQLWDMDNNVIAEIPLKLANKKDQFYTSDVGVVPPNKTFKVVIKAYDPTTKKEITRISLTPIEPQLRDTSIPNKAPIVTSVVGEKIIVDYNDPVALKCKVSGHPKPDVIWERGDGTILESRLSLVELPYDYISVLNLERVISNNTYQCMARNDYGKDSKHIKVETKAYFNVLAKPKGRVIKLNEKATFECKIDAKPAAEIMWYKHGEEIKEDENYEISGDKSTFIINAMQPEDIGKYSCRAKNAFTGQIFHFILQISDVEPPQIDKTVSEIRTKEGSNVQIPCKVIKGNPSPTIEWFFKHESDDEEIIIDESAGEELLEIEEASPAFVGTYRCEASNGGGVDFHNIELVLDYPPTISGESMDILAKDGDNVKLPCVVDGEPKPAVTWLLNDTELDLTKVRRSIYSNSISFRASHKDAGVYVCRAENEHGSVDKTIHLQIVTPPMIEPPSESTLSVNVGGHLALPCLADGNPKPKIQWIFHSKDVKSPDVHLKGHESTGMLTLPRIQVSKQGYYTCVASNDGGSANITYEVNVYAPPNIENIYPEKTFSAVVGDLVTRVPCNATGNPKPDITWIKDGIDRVAAGTEWYDIEEDGTLVIKNVDKFSAGLYMCQARNRLGVDTETYEVEVEAYPKPGSPTKTLLLKAGSSATLQCDVPHKKTDSVRWFKDGILLSSLEELPLTNITPRNSGIYTCRVSNFAKSKSGSIKVKVGFKPRFSYDENENIDFEENLLAVMDCTAEGEPAPQMSWWHEGVKLSTTDMTYVVEMKPEIRGQYFCIVKNEFGNIIRGFNIVSRECILDIKSDFIEKQPLMVSPLITWPTFETNKGQIKISPNEYIRLYCSDGFENFKKKDIIVSCDRERNFTVDGTVHRFSDFSCKDEIKPVEKRTGKSCLFSSPNYETIKIGYEVRGRFLEAYDICLDKDKKSPVYAKHVINYGLSDVDLERTKWHETELLPFNFNELYNCELQINTISSILGKWFHNEDNCCFSKRQLVNPRDMIPGLSQVATYSNLNVVPHWSSCNTQNWESIERRVRQLAKSTNQDLLIWTGTAQQLKISDKDISIYDRYSKSQPVPRYLWKVVKDPSTTASIAIVQLNIPDVSLVEAYRHMPCRDMCNDVIWLRNKHWRDVTKGYTFCCTINEFERAFGYVGVFGRSSGEVLHDVSRVPVDSLT